MMHASPWDGLIRKPNPYARERHAFARVEKTRAAAPKSKAEKLETFLRANGPMCSLDAQLALGWSAREIRSALKRAPGVMPTGEKVEREIDMVCVRRLVGLKPGALKRVSPQRQVAIKMAELLAVRGTLTLEQIRDALGTSPTTTRNTLYSNLDLFKIVRNKGTTKTRAKFSVYECN